MTSRRSFLIGLTSVLAAPAIVRADSLMKLWVPPAPKIIRADEPDWEGRLYVGTTAVGHWTQHKGMISYRYDAGDAIGEVNSGYGIISVQTALYAFPAYGVTPYPNVLPLYGVRA